MKKLKLKRSKYMTFAYSKKGKCNLIYSNGKTYNASIVDFAFNPKQINQCLYMIDGCNCKVVNVKLYDEITIIDADSLVKVETNFNQYFNYYLKALDLTNVKGGE